MTTHLSLEERIEEFQGRVFTDLAAGYGGVMVSVGAKLGLYVAMAGAGPLTSHDVAKRAGCAERYVREWLNSQAAAGYVDYDRGMYELPPERAAVLADPEHRAHLTPAFEVVASMWLDEQLTLEAFRTGKGVPWGAHDERLSHGVAAFFRPGYRALLVPQWLPAMTGTVGRLKAGALVADIGCGHGHSTILMAEAFPRSRFYGYDSDPQSIEAARANAAAAGVDERVSFETCSATEYPKSPTTSVRWLRFITRLLRHCAARTRSRRESTPSAPRRARRNLPICSPRQVFGTGVSSRGQRSTS